MSSTRHLALTLLVASSLSLTSAYAEVVEVELTVTLNPSQVYNCLADYGVTVPRCWVPGRLPSGDFSYPSFPPTTLEQGDTLRVIVTFADGYRLRWADDGLNIQPYGDEFFGVTALSSGGDIPVLGTFANAFEFLDPSGDLSGAQFSWTWSSFASQEPTLRRRTMPGSMKRKR